MFDQTKAIADRYIGRDGSEVGTYSKNRELTRAAVLAAQSALAAEHGGKSPISNGDMHKALLAAVKAAPEIFKS